MAARPRAARPGPRARPSARLARGRRPARPLAMRASPGRALRLGGADLEGALGTAADRRPAARSLADAGIAHRAPEDRSTPRGSPAPRSAVLALPHRPRRRGARCLAEGPVVAIVGSRRATATGLALARRGPTSAERGAVVVSGPAHGIDAAAHEGALAAGAARWRCTGRGQRRLSATQPGPRAAYGRVRHPGLGVLARTPPAPWRSARNRVVAGLRGPWRSSRRGGARERSSRPTSAWSWGARRSRCRAGRGRWPPRGATGSCAPAPGCSRRPPTWSSRSRAPVAGGGSGGGGSGPRGARGRHPRALQREPMGADRLAGELAEGPAVVAGALALLEVEGLVVRGEGQRFWAAPVARAARLSAGVSGWAPSGAGRRPGGLRRSG